MELRLLQYFLAVAKEESISGAANFLHISQPTLSRQLKDFEEELGVNLFIRGNRRIALTEEGRLLRKRSEEIISLVNKAQSELNSPNGVLNGEIYIGGGETEAMRLIAQFINTFNMSHPHVKYHFFSGNADDVTERLDKGLLDFGVLIGHVNMDKYDSVQLPTTDTWGLLMRKDNPLAAQNSIKPKDLLKIPLLCSRQTLVENEIYKWFGEKKDRLNIIATYNLVYNASLMVEAGIGCALCLDNLVNTTEGSSLCFKPLEPSLDTSLYVVWKKHQVFSRAAEKFLMQFKDYLLELPPF